MIDQALEIVLELGSPLLCNGVGLSHDLFAREVGGVLGRSFPLEKNKMKEFSG